MSTTVLHHPKGDVCIEDADSGLRRITVHPAEDFDYSPCLTCSTTYPDDLVEAMLAVKGPEWLCEEIRRESDEGYVERNSRFAMLPFVDPVQLRGARLLDFGCGSGASTLALRRILPETEIVGIELDGRLLDLARRRVAHAGLENVELHVSPGPEELPADLGTFDAICFSAVFEHLLPDERRRLVPLVWSHLRPGGLLFVYETPHRWSVRETHTTGVPLLNFLPDRLAHRVAWLSPRIPRGMTWETLLRDGVRGGTVGQVLDALDAGDAATVIRPWRMGLHSPVDLWYAKGAPSAKRRAVRAVLRAVNRFGDGWYVPWLYVAVRKER